MQVFHKHIESGLELPGKMFVNIFGKSCEIFLEKKSWFWFGFPNLEKYLHKLFNIDRDAQPILLGKYFEINNFQNTTGKFDIYGLIIFKTQQESLIFMIQ